MSHFEFDNTRAGAVIRLNARSQGGVLWTLRIDHVNSEQRHPSGSYIAREHERRVHISRGEDKKGYLVLRDRSQTDFMDDVTTKVTRIPFIAVEIYRCAVPLCEMPKADIEAAVGLVLEYVKVIQGRCVAND